MLSERVKNIGQSSTMKISAKAIAMRAEGIDVVNFSVGEPDFPTPQFIKEAGIKAINKNQTRYTVNAGRIDLRQAIAKKLKEENNLEYDPADIIVTNGAKQAVFNAVCALVSDDDEVIIPAPYWVSYPEMVALCGGKSVIVPTREENGFKLTAAELKNAITASTKAMIFCSPSNPTGATYTRPELEALVEVLEEENIFVIADEIYEKLIFDAFKFVSLASISPKIKDITILINGVSKAFAMTGWRIGYAAGPKEIIKAMDKIQSHSTSNASSISQQAALEAISGPQFEVSRMVAEFQRRRNYVVQRLNTMDGVRCNVPEGAFYVFPNISSFFGKEYNGTFIRNSYGMAYYLLRESQVALVPGAAFGMENYIRISYANSMENLEKGMNRMAEALRLLKVPSKIKFKKLDNYQTRSQKTVKVDSQLNHEKRDALVAEAEAQLKYDQYYEWNANINGVIIQLRTNHQHLYHFWIENWYPAQLESDLEPHAIIYAVDGMIGREAYGFYHADSRTGLLFNCDLYEFLRSMALGVVADIGSNVFNMHAIRGMSADLNGKGFILIGPKGTHKSELFYLLLQEEGIALHSNDMILVRYGGGYAAADLPERKLYFRTNTIEIFPGLTDLIERSPCENVITRQEECSYDKCPILEECSLEKGMPYCLTASTKSAAVLDPYWIGGMTRHVKRTDIHTVFLLKANTFDPVLKNLDARDALQRMETGNQGGTIFFNPHLLAKDEQQIDRQRRSFEKLFQTASCYELNTGAASPVEVIAQVMVTLK